MSATILGRVQRALEGLYRVDAQGDVADYVITAEERCALGVQRSPREQLLLRSDAESLEVGLFLDEEMLGSLEGPLGEERLPDLLITIEGVSHFIYVMVRARAERPFSALELELQAEVDKYLMSLLGTWPHHGPPPKDLRRTLFGRVSLLPDLSGEERERYQTANAMADEYAATLEERFVRRRAVDDLLDEVRRFYRLDCAGKMDRITHKAA